MPASVVLARPGQGGAWSDWSSPKWDLVWDGLRREPKRRSCLWGPPRFRSYPNNDSLPEFMNFKLFGNTILVANIKFGLFWAIPSANEFRSYPNNEDYNGLVDPLTP